MVQESKKKKRSHRIRRDMWVTLINPFWVSKVGYEVDVQTLKHQIVGERLYQVAAAVKMMLPADITISCETIIEMVKEDFAYDLEYQGHPSTWTFKDVKQRSLVERNILSLSKRIIGNLACIELSARKLTSGTERKLFKHEFPDFMVGCRLECSGIKIVKTGTYYRGYRATYPEDDSHGPGLDKMKTHKLIQVRSPPNDTAELYEYLKAAKISAKIPGGLQGVWLDDADVVASDFYEHSLQRLEGAK